MSVNFVRLKDVIDKPISGEWGDGEGNISILRTTNFTKDGKLDLKEVVQRNIDSKKIAQKQLVFGDTIIEKSGGSPSQPVGRVVYFDQKSGVYLCNNFTSVIRSKSDIDARYLFWFLFNNHLTKNTLKYQNKTTGIINLQLERYIEELQIPLPPLATQKRIAEILDAADALRRKDQELLKKYDELAQAIFIDMFGDPVKNEKGWDVKKLGSVTNMKAGNFISASEINTEFEDGLYPCYGGNGLRGFVKSFTHNGNYILIGRQGALCGNVKITTGKFHATEHAVVCSPKIEYNVLWFYYLLGALNLNQYASGAAQPGLNVSTLVDIELIFAPLKFQNQFAEKLEMIDIQKSNLKGSLINTSHLFNSLIQKAFKGELVS
jgi:type I restriction enzyme S subunit